MKCCSTLPSSKITLDRSYRLDRLEREALAVGVTAVEGWGSAASYRIRPDGSESDNIYLEAPPADTAMLRPTS